MIAAYLGITLATLGACCLGAELITRRACKRIHEINQRWRQP